MQLKQSGYGNIEVDNTEKDIIQIWYFEQDESNVVQVRRENLKQLITALIACDKDEFTIMQYVRLYAYKPVKAIAEDLGITNAELKNIMDKFGTTISEMRGNLDAFKANRRRTYAKANNNQIG